MEEEVSEETILKGEVACGTLLFKDFCANMAKIEKMRTYDRKMSTLFNEGLKKMMQAEASKQSVQQSLFPLVRLLIPINDNVRKKYGLKQATVATTYIDALHLNPTSADAQRLKFWKNPSKLSGDLAQKTSGDLGEVLQDVLKTRISVENSTLTISDINSLLDQLAASSGEAQTALIRRHILNVLSPSEQKWLMRIVFQDMKIGLKYENVLKWLNPNALQRYNECTDLRQICREIASGALSSSGDDSAGGSRGISLFTCFQPMLAKGFTTSGQINEVEGCMNKHPFVMDVKLDGERMLCHVSKRKDEKGKGIFWTRNGNDYSSTYRALLDDIIENVQCEACILDGEVCAWEESTQQFIPFGQNRTVAKYEQASQSERLSSTVSSGSCLVYVLFDILFLEGLRDMNGSLLRRDQWKSLIDYEKIIPGGLQSLQAEESKEACRAAYARDSARSSFSCDILHMPLIARRALLSQAIQLVPTRIQMVKHVSVYTSNVLDRKRQIENYFNKVTSEREEGLVVKDLLSPYSLGLKSRQLKHWVKMKPEYSDMTRDLDMIILGAYYGEGKSMRGKGLSTFLCGVREKSSLVSNGSEASDDAMLNVADMKFKTVCKVGTGYSFFQLEELRGKLAPVVKEWDKTNRKFKPPHFCTWSIRKTDDIPDVWIPPEHSIIVELKCAQLVMSNDFSVGMTCRFPRLRKIRYDKNVCEVMTDDDLKEVVALPRMNVAEAADRGLTESKPKKRIGKRKGGPFSHNENLVSSQFLVPAVGRQQKLDSTIFQGKIFCIIESTFSVLPNSFTMKNESRSPLLKYATKKNGYKLTRLQVIEVIQLNGGDVVANPMPNCFVIIGDKRTMQTKSLIDAGKNDILSFQYIIDALNGFINDEYINPNPTHFLGYTPETRVLFGGLFDEFGDSYADDVDEAQLKSIFNRLDDTVASLHRKRNVKQGNKNTKRKKKGLDCAELETEAMDERVEETLQLSRRLEHLDWREMIQSGILDDSDYADILDESKWNVFWRSNTVLYLDIFNELDHINNSGGGSDSFMVKLGQSGALFLSSESDPSIILKSLSPNSSRLRSVIPELILHGAQISPSLSDHVTHVVVDFENNYCVRRERALQARLRELRMTSEYRYEKRIVNVEWVADCLALREIVIPQAAHEINWISSESGS